MARLARSILGPPGRAKKFILDITALKWYSMPNKPLRKCKYAEQVPFREPQTVGTGQGALSGMGFRGRTERSQVGEPEGISVIKAGVCQYAQSGRFSAPSRVAPQKYPLLSQREC